MMPATSSGGCRVLFLLACAVIVPVVALSGASWPEILKKFQGIRFPAILDPAAAATTAEPSLKSPRASTEAALPETRGNAANPATFATIAGTELDDLQHRLQTLGATYYRLETWGDESPQFRFFCKMTLAGDASCVRCFEASQADPLQAMRQVLREVEAWRGLP